MGGVCSSDETFLAMNIFVSAAAQTGNLEMMQKLYEGEDPTQPRMNPNEQDQDGNAALHFACEMGRVAICRYLIESCRAHVDVENKRGDTPLRLACINGHMRIVEMLLKHNAGVNYANAMEERPLHAAVLGGHAGVVQILVEQKADINAASKNGLTPLVRAALSGSEDVAEYLLEHGANARALCGGKTAAEWAREGGFDDLASMLQRSAWRQNMNKAMLETSPTLNFFKTVEGKTRHQVRGGSTPLHWAVACRDVRIVRQLVQKGINISARDAQGRTPRALATDLGFIVISTFLLRAEKERKVITDEQHAEAVLTLKQVAYEPGLNGRPTLHVQAMRGNTQHVSLLLDELGLNVNSRDPAGDTPLILAACFDQIDAARLLIEKYSAQVQLRGSQGLTAAEYAVRLGSELVAKYLMSHATLVPCPNDSIPRTGSSKAGGLNMTMTTKTFAFTMAATGLGATVSDGSIPSLDGTQAGTKRSPRMRSPKARSPRTRSPKDGSPTMALQFSASKLPGLALEATDEKATQDADDMESASDGSVEMIDEDSVATGSFAESGDEVDVVSVLSSSESDIQSSASSFDTKDAFQVKPDPNDLPAMVKAVASLYKGLTVARAARAQAKASLEERVDRNAILFKQMRACKCVSDQTRDEHNVSAMLKESAGPALPAAPSNDDPELCKLYGELVLSGALWDGTNTDTNLTDSNGKLLSMLETLKARCKQERRAQQELEKLSQEAAKSNRFIKAHLETKCRCAKPSELVWNEAFQRALESQNMIEMYKVAYDFEELCRLYGKVILSEYWLDDKDKTVKPASAFGGTAGGQKYIARGILFKLMRDPDIPGRPGQHIYGGSSERLDLAFKAASAELRGANAYAGAFVRACDRKNSVTCPLQVVIDYAGHRVVAMPLLPIDSSTLCYGGDNERVLDGASAPKDLREKVDRAAHELHLADHACRGAGSSTEKRIRVAGDNEVHVGSDGKHYMIDMARSLPPQAPKVVDHLTDGRASAVFFRFFRPEALQRLRAEGFPALSVDALTGFSRGTSDSAVHNRHARLATEVLLRKWVPKLAQDLLGGRYGPRGPRMALSKELNNLVRHNNISNILHTQGINVHHIGLLRKCVRHVGRRSRTLKRNGMLRLWSEALLIEILARALKRMIRAKLRSTLHENTLQTSAFALALSAVTLLRAMWSGALAEQLRAKAVQIYGECTFGRDESVTNKHRILILERTVEMCGWRLDPYLDLENKESIALGDVRLAPRLRGLGQVHFAKAYCQLHGYGDMQSDASTVSAAPQSFVRAAVCGEPHSVAWCRGRGVGPFGPADEPAELRLLQNLVPEGRSNPYAQCCVGECFERKAHKLEADAGDDAEAKSKVAVEVAARAFRAYRAAAVECNAFARHKLGWCYQAGFGVERDSKLAIEWYLAAIELEEDTEAMLRLARIYKAQEDIDKAISMYERAAAQGKAAAQHELGLLYLDKGARNRAFRLFKQAADQGLQESSALWSVIPMLAPEARGRFLRGGASDRQCLHTSVSGGPGTPDLPEGVRCLNPQTKELFMDNVRMPTFAPFFRQLAQLRGLVYSHSAALLELPKRFCNLPAGLKALEMHGDFASRPSALDSADEIKALPPRLERFVLRGSVRKQSKLETLPRDISALLMRSRGTLRILNLSRNALRSVPCSVFDQPTLERLDLSHNRLVDLWTPDAETPEPVVRAPRLWELRLAHNQLTEIPGPILSPLCRLRELDVSNNPLLRALPACASHLPLRALFVRRTSIRSLPQLTTSSVLSAFDGNKHLESNNTLSGDYGAVYRLGKGLESIDDLLKSQEAGSLRFVYAPNNRIGALAGLAKLHPRLVMLCFDQNNISKIPDDLSILTRLRRLSLFSNHIKDLPASFVRLQALRFLDLGRNELKAVPEILFQLSLEHLNLSLNFINKVPESFGRLGKTLRFLNLDGNPLEEANTALGVLAELSPVCELLLPASMHTDRVQEALAQRCVNPGSTFARSQATGEVNLRRLMPGAARSPPGAQREDSSRSLVPPSSPPPVSGDSKLRRAFSRRTQRTNRLSRIGTRTSVLSSAMDSTASGVSYGVSSSGIVE